jgi:MFS family permease
VSADPIVWTVMRFVFGFCAAGLYVVIESWLNEMSPPASRGRTLAIYMIVSMGGLGVGQLLLAVADPGGFRLFVLSSVLVSMSLVPMTLAATTTPPPVRLPEPMTVRDLLANVPTGVVAALAGGVGAGILLGLGAVYASRVGMSAGRTGLFIAAPTIGAICLQLPIGRLSDRVSRRLVILGDAVALVAVALALVAIPPDHPVELPLMFLLGGLLFPLYSLAVSYTLDWTPVHRTVAASGTLVRINGAGAIAGPLVAAALMSSFGADWFFWTIVVAGAVVVAFVAVRVVIADPLPVERQRRFVNLPARASELVLRLAPHSRRARERPRSR